MSGSTKTEGITGNLTVKRPAKVTQRNTAAQPLSVHELRNGREANRSRRSSYAGTAVATTYRRASSSGVIAVAANASASATARWSRARKQARRGSQTRVKPAAKRSGSNARPLFFPEVCSGRWGPLRLTPMCGRY